MAKEAYLPDEPERLIIHVQVAVQKEVAVRVALRLLLPFKLLFFFFFFFFFLFFFFFFFFFFFLFFFFFFFFFFFLFCFLFQVALRRLLQRLTLTRKWTSVTPVSCCCVACVSVKRDLITWQKRLISKAHSLLRMRLKLWPIAAITSCDDDRAVRSASIMALRVT